jgi:ABC-type multidrug transport system ATPase subunit
MGCVIITKYMAGSILSCKGLTKEFGSVKALDNLEFSLELNGLFCLLGLNGAGKTTLIKCLLGLIKPSSGEIYFKGKPLQQRDIQDHFSYLPESFQLYRELTASELLRILSLGLKKISVKAQDALESVGLLNKADKKIKTYSRGMIQRLGLAVCLIKKPQLVFLDDPFLGLDIMGQIAMIEVIKKLKNQDQTVLFSSHILSQVEKVADSVGIIDKGAMLFCGSTKEFLNKHSVASLEAAFLKEVSSK